MEPSVAGEPGSAPDLGTDRGSGRASSGAILVSGRCVGGVVGPCRSEGPESALDSDSWGARVGSGPELGTPGLGNGCCTGPCSSPGAGTEPGGGGKGPAEGIPCAVVPTGRVLTGGVGGVSMADGRTFGGQIAVPGGVPGGVLGGAVPVGVAHHFASGRTICSSAPASPAAKTKTKRLRKSAASRAKLFWLRGRIRMAALR
jgi:hypothetical protein